MKRLLLLATNNPGKVKEYRLLLGELPFTFTTPAEQGVKGEAEETGATFQENALLKARYYAVRSSLLTLADDSGLEVDALGGEPGVRSARYAGPKASDQERIRYLLDRLKDVPWERRSARFRCVIALVWPSGREEAFHGTAEGYVAFEPKGENGFGYDPVFYMPQWGVTMAQLDIVTKNRVSHRSRAAFQVVEWLKQQVEALAGPA